jgi:hypothetical protein
MPKIRAMIIGKGIILLRNIVVRAGIFFAPSEKVAGISIVDITDGKRRDFYFGVIRDALSLIEASDPLQWRRVRRYVPRILISRVHGPEYWHFANACVLSVKNVEDADRRMLAAVVVHEMVHARLSLASIPYNEEIRPRVERLCVKTEIAFLKKVEGSEDFIQHLTRNMDNAFYTDDELRQRLIKIRDASS